MISSNDIPDPMVRKFFIDKFLKNNTFKLALKGTGSNGENYPQRWTPIDMQQAFEYVGGTNAYLRTSEPVWVAEDIEKYIINNSVCVEFGCGFGRILLKLSEILAYNKKDVKLVGVDFNEEMLKLAHEYTKYFKLQYELVFPPLFVTKLESLSIDFIYSHATLIHNAPSQLNCIFKECVRILTRDGKMIHDFLNSGNEKALDEIRSSSLIGFPLYGYTIEDIDNIAEYFNLSCKPISNTNNARMRFLFWKNNV
jgi:SAM-dependent methyltransferase